MSEEEQAQSGEAKTREVPRHHILSIQDGQLVDEEFKTKGEFNAALTERKPEEIAHVYYGRPVKLGTALVAL